MSGLSNVEQNRLLIYVVLPVSYVIAGRLEPDEALEKLTKPRLFGLAIGQEIRHRKTRRTAAVSL